MKNHLSYWFSLMIILPVALLLAGHVTPAYAGGVVGTGTPGSCTESALNTSLTGGGNVTFNCGPNPVTILLSASKTIAVNTVMDGGNLVTLDGHSSIRLFGVNAGAVLTLNNLALINGYNATGDGGAVRNDGTLVVNNSRFANNSTVSSFSGGAIVSYGPLTITDSLFEDNSAGSGGAIYPRWTGGTTLIANSLLRNNHTTNTTNGWGGAMLLWDGASVTLVASDVINNSAREGGAAYVTTNSTLVIKGKSTLRNNTASVVGGGVQNSGTLRVDDAEMDGNTTDLGGGGIYNLGVVSLIRGRITNNRATNPNGQGGGVFNTSAASGMTTIYGSAEVMTSTFSGNAAWEGAGIDSQGPLTLAASTLSGNLAGLRGGALNQLGGVITLTQVTLSGNDGGYHGGAIYKSAGTLQVSYSTIVSNTGLAEGANIYLDLGQGATATFDNSLLAYGACYGDSVTSAGNNMDSGSTCGLSDASDRNNTDPQLLPLGENGGPTETHLPAPASPAIDTAGGACPAADQRGFGRPGGAACDVGALEVGGATPEVQVNEPVGDASDYALGGARLFWFRQGDCPTSGSTSAISIARLAIQGALPARDVYQTAASCAGGGAKSNIVADESFVYWTTDAGLMRQSTQASAADAPQVFYAGLSGKAELAMDPSFVIGLKNGTVWLIDKSDGLATTLMGYNATSKPAASQTSTGHFVFWLSGNSLKRYDVINGGVATIPGSVAAYLPAGARQHCYGGDPARCENADIVFVSVGNQVISHDNLTGKTDVVLTSDKTIYDLALDGDTLFTAEEKASSGVLSNYVYGKLDVGKPNYTSLTSKLVTSKLDTSARAIDKLSARNGYVFWQSASSISQVSSRIGDLLKPNVQVTGMEVTQGIQTANQDVYLIRNRRTFVRVYIQSTSIASQPLAGITAQLTVYGYNKLGTLQPIWPNPSPFLFSQIGFENGQLVFKAPSVNITAQASPDRTNLDHSFLFELPLDWTNTGPWPLVLIAEVNPNHTPAELTYDDNKLMKGYTFYDSPRLQVQFVAWGYSLPGVAGTIIPSQRDIDQIYSYIRRTYPLATTPGTDASPTPGFRPGIWWIYDDQLGARVNQTAWECQDHTIPMGAFTIQYKGLGNLCASAYTNRRMQEMRIVHVLPFVDVVVVPDNIFMYGIISDTVGPGNTLFPRGQACCGTNVSSGPTSAFTWGWDNDGVSGDWYAAHEIGHTLGQGHPKTGNSSQDGCQTYDKNDSSIVDSVPHQYARIGADNNTLGFDFGDQRLGLPKQIYQSTQWHDFMSYCNNQWISDYTYRAIYTYMRNHPTLYAAGVPGHAQRAPTSMNQARVAGDWLLVQGDILPASSAAAILTLNRLSSVAQMPPRVAGDYAIQLIGASNNLLAEYAFTPDGANDATNGRLSFTQVVTHVIGTQSVHIVKKPGNTLIGFRALGGSPPAVSDVQLHTSLALASVTDATLSWTASDPDGDPLTFDVFYSTDGGLTMLPLRTGVTGTSTTVDATRLGGGTAILRVVASDGTFTAQADSASFSAAMKPPVPRILTESGLRVHYGDVVNLSGMAEDFQNDNIADGSLVWSNAAGVMGVSNALSVSTLPIGANVITLTATNSQGLSATASITVVVQDSLDLLGPTLSASPQHFAFAFPRNPTTAQTATLNISNMGSGALTWTASENAAWLTVGAASGSAPASLVLTVNPVGVPSGASLNTVLTLQSSNGPVTQTIEIPVLMSVGVSFNDPARYVYLPIVVK